MTHEHPLIKRIQSMEMTTDLRPVAGIIIAVAEFLPAALRTQVRYAWRERYTALGFAHVSRFPDYDINHRKITVEVEHALGGP